MVKQLKPIVEGLEKEGIKVEWLDLTPSRFGMDNYYLAVAAKWKKNMHTGDKVDSVISKLFAIPYEKSGQVLLVLVYDSQKELQEDMLERWDYHTENLYPLVANGRMVEMA